MYILEEYRGLEDLFPGIVKKPVSRQSTYAQHRHVGEIGQEIESDDYVIGRDLLYTLGRGLCEVHKNWLSRVLLIL